VAARLQNFSHAATLLGMTQSAVSQHVTVVEQTIGQPLFRRLHRGVALTEAGIVLYAAVGQGLDTIAAALNELRREPRAPALSIATDFGFASFWLMPRLEALGRALPGVEIRIVTTQNGSQQALIDADVTIIFGVPDAGAMRRTAPSTGAACLCWIWKGRSHPAGCVGETGSRPGDCRRAGGGRRRCISTPIRWWWRRPCWARVPRSAGNRCSTAISPRAPWCRWPRSRW
jgi:DNA-binding transcriptional LysR family regulator